MREWITSVLGILWWLRQTRSLWIHGQLSFKVPWRQTTRVLSFFFASLFKYSFNCNLFIWAPPVFLNHHQRYTYTREIILGEGVLGVSSASRGMEVLFLIGKKKERKERGPQKEPRKKTWEKALFYRKTWERLLERPENLTPTTALICSGFIYWLCLFSCISVFGWKEISFYFLVAFDWQVRGGERRKWKSILHLSVVFTCTDHLRCSSLN